MQLEYKCSICNDQKWFVNSDGYCQFCECCLDTSIGDAGTVHVKHPLTPYRDDKQVEETQDYIINWYLYEN